MTTSEREPLADRLARLESNAKRALDLQRQSERRETLRSRVSEIVALEKKLGAITGTVRALVESGMIRRNELPDNHLHGTRASVESLLRRSEAGIEQILVGNAFAEAKSALTALNRRLEHFALTRWREGVGRVLNLATDEDLAFFNETASSRARDIMTGLNELRGQRAHVPTSPSAVHQVVERMHTLESLIAETWVEALGDDPHEREAVRTFIAAAKSPAGASLAEYPETVQDWIRRKGWTDRVRVVIRPRT